MMVPVAVPMRIERPSDRLRGSFGPTVYAVRWKKNVHLGMVVRCSLKTLGVTLIAGLVLGRV